MNSDFVDISDRMTQQLLVEFGDVLEQMMFADNGFFNSFNVYGEIWARYILPNRELHGSTFATKRWRKLAQFHYSAVVRCWNVRNVRKEICRLCDALDGGQTVASDLLSIHEQIVAFFGCIGGAHDNMQNCFNAWPVESADTFSKCRGNGETKFTLAWLYARRTQAVHKALIPIWNYNGQYALDMGLLLNKDTDWEQANWREAKEIGELVDSAYRGFSDGMLSCWSNLYDILKKNYPAEKPTMLRPEQLYHSFGSGTGRSSGMPSGSANA